MTLSYPDKSIQNMVGDWWEKDDSRDFRRGRLIRAMLPHVVQTPTELVATGRADPTNHSKANYELREYRIHQRAHDRTLPVAGLPEIKSEKRLVFRSKKRPCIIISSGGADLPEEFRKALSKAKTTSTILVAPSYGADQDGTREGFPPALVERIQQCEYRQFFWDRFPVFATTDSIIRMDHIQPLGRHQDSVEFSEYCLTREALEIIDEWLYWLVKDKLRDGSQVKAYREFFASL